MLNALKIIIISLLYFNLIHSQTQSDTLNRFNARNKKEGFWKVYLTDYLIETRDSTQAYYFAYDYYVNGHLIIWTSAAQYYKKKAIKVTTDNQSNKGQPVLLKGHFQFYYNYGLGLDEKYNMGLPEKILTIGADGTGKSVTVESADYTKKYNNLFGSFLYERFNLLLVDQVEIKEAFSYNMTPATTREIKKIIYQHFDLIVDSWNNYFKK